MAIDDLQPGFFCTPGGPWMHQGNVSTAATRAFFQRFVCPRSMQVKYLVFFVQAISTSDDAIDVGIYDSAGPTLNLLGSSGSKSGLTTSVGYKVVQLASPVNLVKDQVYYAAIAQGTISGTGCTFHGTAANSGHTQIFGGAPPQSEIFCIMSGAFPLPASAGPSFTVVNVPIMALTQ